MPGQWHEKVAPHCNNIMSALVVASRVGTVLLIGSLVSIANHKETKETEEVPLHLRQPQEPKV